MEIKDEVSSKIQQFIDENITEIAHEIVDEQYAKNPQLFQLYGIEGKKKSLLDTKHHLSFLATAIKMDNSQIFLDYIIWVKNLFNALNIDTKCFLENIVITNEVLKKKLNDNHLIIQKFVEEALETFPRTTSIGSYINENQPLAELAKSYLHFLLNGEREKASKQVLDAIKNGVDPKLIYLWVFQKTQQEIGQLWQQNKITVAQEHYSSAVTQMIMSIVYASLPPVTKEKPWKIVTASVSGEQHEIGIRMVSDFFGMEGWKTYYLGANTPTSSIIQTLETIQPNLLALSATLPPHLKTVEDLIRRVRENEKTCNIKIIVGGYAFSTSNTTAEKVGADFYAKDAIEAIELANKFFP